MDGTGPVDMEWPTRLSIKFTINSLAGQLHFRLTEGTATPQTCNVRDMWSLGPKHTTLKYSSAWNSGLFQTFSFGVTQHGAFGLPPHLTEYLAEDLTRGEAHRPHTLFPTGDQITLALFLLEFIPDAGSGGLLSWQFPEATHFFHQNISTDHAVSMNSFYGHICHNTTLV